MPLIWFRSEQELGGHFSGSKVTDLVLDNGMVLLEKESPYLDAEKLPLQELGKRDCAPNGTGVREFLQASYTWLSALGNPFSEVSMRTEISGSLGQDFFIADHLEILNRIPKVEQNLLLEEIQLRRQTWMGDLHPANKNSNPSFLHITLGDYCHLVYGPTFVEYFLNPIVRTFGPDVLTVPANQHRQIWFPLYFPESLLQAMEPSGLDPLQGQMFHVPYLSSVASMVRKMTEVKISEACQIRRIEEFDGYTRSGEAHRGDLGTAWLAGQSESNRLSVNNHGLDAGIPRSNGSSAPAHMQVRIQFYEVDEALGDSCVFFTSHPGLYRATSRVLNSAKTGSHQIVAIETSDSVRHPTISSREVLSTYFACNSVRELGEAFGRVRLSRVSANAIHPASVDRTEGEWNPFRKQSGIPASFMSFNDQLILGLWTAERISCEFA